MEFMEHLEENREDWAPYLEDYERFLDRYEQDREQFITCLEYFIPMAKFAKAFWGDEHLQILPNIYSTNFICLDLKQSKELTLTKFLLFLEELEEAFPKLNCFFEAADSSNVLVKKYLFEETFYLVIELLPDLNFCKRVNTGRIIKGQKVITVEEPEMIWQCS